MTPPRHRLAVDTPLAEGVELLLEGNPAHYLSHVLRMAAGDAVALFNREDGEWRAEIADIRKKSVMLRVVECMRPPSARGETSLPGHHGFHLTVCFAPIKGGRLETIIEKATELGASVLQPVITQRTIVDKVNLPRAEAIAREAAEQCERIDWPEIREPVTLEKLLGDWPADLPLIYGDETGGGVAVTELFDEGGVSPHQTPPEPRVALYGASREAAGVAAAGCEGGVSPPAIVTNWAILTGPEGGFTPAELALLKRVPPAIGVGLGPRILRADTAIIALCALTLAAWGDWHRLPRFVDS